MSEQDFGSMRRLMVSNQLRTSAVTDMAVLAAMGAVRRERFVGDDQLGVAYRDTIVRLAPGRGLNPPLATAKMLQAAQVLPGQRALVVGAGTGYVAAVLAEMGAGVTALEEDATLAARARLALADTDVAVVEGPLAAGWPQGAPYDVIVVDGVVERVPEALSAQLADYGVLVAAIADRGIAHLVEGRRATHGFGTIDFADSEMAPLPGFAPAPAFAF